MFPWLIMNKVPVQEATLELTHILNVSMINYEQSPSTGGHIGTHPHPECFHDKLWTNSQYTREEATLKLTHILKVFMIYYEQSPSTPGRRPHWNSPTSWKFSLYIMENYPVYQGGGHIESHPHSEHFHHKSWENTQYIREETTPELTHRKVIIINHKSSPPIVLLVFLNSFIQTF
jgi:hypothetical protein